MAESQYSNSRNKIEKITLEIVLVSENLFIATLIEKLKPVEMNGKQE